MSQRRMFNCQVMIGDESTYGTAVTRTVSVGRIQVATVNIANGLQRSRELSSRKVSETLWGAYDCTWSLEQHFHGQELFEYLVGPRTGIGSSGSPYVFTEASIVGTTDLKFFSMEIISNESTDNGLLLTGCVATSWTISGGLPGTPIRLVANGVAQKAKELTTATSYTEPTTDKFMGHQANFQFGSSPSTLGYIQTWSVTCNNNVLTDRQAGSRFILQPDVGLLDYQYQITSIMDDTTFATIADAHAGQDFASGPVTGEAGALGVTDELRVVISEGSSSGDRTFHVHLDPVFVDTLGLPFRVSSGRVIASFGGHAHSGKSSQPLQWYTV